MLGTYHEAERLKDLYDDELREHLTALLRDNDDGLTADALRDQREENEAATAGCEADCDGLATSGVNRKRLTSNLAHPRSQASSRFAPSPSVRDCIGKSP
jgi:hypothetical protein